MPSPRGITLYVASTGKDWVMRSPRGEREISTIGIVSFALFVRLVSLVVQLSYGRSEIGRVS